MQMYKLWYDYIKEKYGDRTQLFHIDTDNFVIHIKADDFYEDVNDNVEERFDTPNYELEKPLPKKN